MCGRVSVPNLPPRLPLGWASVKHPHRRILCLKDQVTFIVYPFLAKSMGIQLQSSAPVLFDRVPSGSGGDVSWPDSAVLPRRSADRRVPQHAGTAARHLAFTPYSNECVELSALSPITAYKECRPTDTIPTFNTTRQMACVSASAGTRC